MPLYEYECPKCSHRFEEVKKFSDKPDANCPKCTAKANKLISSVPIIFKGSGFYVTDYRKDKFKETTDSVPATPPAAKPADKPKDKSAA